MGGGSICGNHFHHLFKQTSDRLKLLYNTYKNIYYIWIGEIKKNKPLFNQFIKFDGKLKTRTLESEIFIKKNVLKKISRVGNKKPLLWGKGGEKYVYTEEFKNISFGKCELIKVTNAGVIEAKPHLL